MDMKPRNMFEALEMRFSTGDEEVDPWEEAKRILECVARKEKEGAPATGVALDTIIQECGFSRTQGRRLLQIAESLDRERYGHLPIGKLRCLLRFDREEDRWEFISTHNIAETPVRQLEEEIKNWIDGEAPKTEATSADTSPHVSDPPSKDAANDKLILVLSELISLRDRLTSLIEDVEKMKQNQ